MDISATYTLEGLTIYLIILGAILVLFIAVLIAHSDGYKRGLKYGDDLTRKALEDQARDYGEFFRKQLDKILTELKKQK